MKRNTIASLKADIDSRRKVSFIRLKHFIVLDNDHYDRKDFSDPRNVRINENTISFDVENWTTYKSQTVTVNISEVELVYFD